LNFGNRNLFSESHKFSEVLIMAHIPPDPILTIVAGLSVVAGLLFILPFLSNKIEENLEPFFLIMGVASVTISGLWSWDIILEALKSPVMIGSVPVGIFQVVLVVGLLIHYFNKPFCGLILRLMDRLGHKLFVFFLIASLGLLSSLISAILAACLLSEIAVALPFPKIHKKHLVVLTCFSVGMGACLSPLGEPLSTILVAKLSGSPYHAGFFFPLKHLGIYLIPAVLGLALFGAFWIGPKMASVKKEPIVRDPETPKSIIVRAARVYVFISALVLVGEGFRPLMVWYLSKIASWQLYWLNMSSAVLDNATLTAIEIGPAMSLPQIRGIIMGLLVAGGMLIPGNIPNIVVAGRLKISMKEWAAVGLPLGLALMAAFFVILYIL
jgi:predicted cation transporter